MNIKGIKMPASDPVSIGTFADIVDTLQVEINALKESIQFLQLNFFKDEVELKTRMLAIADNLLNLTVLFTTLKEGQLERSAESKVQVEQILSSIQAASDAIAQTMNNSVKISELTAAREVIEFNLNIICDIRQPVTAIGATAAGECFSLLDILVEPKRIIVSNIPSNITEVTLKYAKF